MKRLPLLCLLSLWVGSTLAQQLGPHDVVTVSEGEDALLPCALGSGQSINKFDWKKDIEEEEKKKEVFLYDRGSYYGNGRNGQNEQFKDRIVFFKDKLTSGNASIKIQNTRLEDNGTYTCVLLEPHRQEVNIRLYVGAASVPHVKPIEEENTWSFLQCKVLGVPKPEVEWRNSAGKVLATCHSAKDKHVMIHKDSSGRFHVELRLNVTRSDTYTCVATQRDIYHQINNTLEVHIQDSVAVVAGDYAILPCSLDSKENIQSMVFSWWKDHKKIYSYHRGQVEEDEQFTGRLTLFQHELKSGNASIKIRNTRKTDSGRFSCHFPHIQKSHIKLLVVGNKSTFEYSAGLLVAVVLLQLCCL